MRLIALMLLCLTLTGCLTTDEPVPQANAPAAQSSSPASQPAAATPSDKPAPAQRRAAPAAARAANPPPKSTEPAPDAIMEIRQTCWSEGNKLRVSVEARADFVNKCVADKSKALPTQ